MGETANRAGRIRGREWQLGAMLTLLALVVAACTDVQDLEDVDAPEAPAVTEEAPEDGEQPEARPDPGTLPVPRGEAVHVSVGPDFTNFDSFNQFVPGGAQGGSGYHIAAHEFGWYQQSATGERIMMRIEDWTYEDDDQTFIIHVRDGVNWNDGEPFTAEDIVFTLEMLLDNPDLLGHGDAAQWIESAEAVDELTARIELTSPNPRFHYNFMMWGGPMGQTVAKHVWEGEDPTEFENNPPVETGPYVLHSTHEDLNMFVWERRDDYWGQDIGYFPEPRYFIQSTAAPADVNMSEMLAGNVDTTPPQIFPWDLTVAAQEVSDEIVIAPFVAAGVIGIEGFNLDNPLLAEREGRWAIAKLLDRERLANLYPAAESSVASPLPWPGAAWDTLDPYVPAAEAALARIEADHGFTYGYDPEGAAALLDELGYVMDGDVRVDPDGNPVELVIVSGSQAQEEFFVASDLVDELRDIGIDATIRTADGPPLIDLLNDGQFDLAVRTIDAAPVATQQGDIAMSLDWYRHRGEGDGIPRRQWMTEPNEAYADAIAELFATSPDDPAADELYEEALYLLMQDMLVAPVVERTFVQTFSTEWWTGWPTEDNMYAQPFNWPPLFKFVLFEVEPVT